MSQCRRDFFKKISSAAQLSLPICLCLKARDAVAVFASQLGPRIDHLGPGESDGGHYSLVAHKFIWDGKEVGKNTCKLQECNSRYLVCLLSNEYLCRISIYSTICMTL